MAVDDAHGLGLDRDAAAMLLVESDLPGAAGAERAGRGAKPRSANAPVPTLVVQAAGRAGGRLAARRPGASRSARSRRKGTVAHGGRRRAAQPDPGDAARDRARSPRAHGSRVGTFGHAGDGNLHPNFIFDRDDADGERRLHDVQTRSVRGGARDGRDGDRRARHRRRAARRGSCGQRGEDAVAGHARDQGGARPTGPAESRQGV